MPALVHDQPETEGGRGLKSTSTFVGPYGTGTDASRASRRDAATLGAGVSTLDPPASDVRLPHRRQRHPGRRDRPSLIGSRPATHAVDEFAASSRDVQLSYVRTIELMRHLGHATRIPVAP